MFRKDGKREQREDKVNVIIQKVHELRLKPRDSHLTRHRTSYFHKVALITGANGLSGVSYRRYRTYLPYQAETPLGENKFSVANFLVSRKKKKRKLI